MGAKKALRRPEIRLRMQERHLQNVSRETFCHGKKRWKKILGEI